jgi:signal peptidase II
MRFVVFILVALFGGIIDLVTKELAFSSPRLEHGGKIVVIEGWFDLLRSENQGSAFGLFWGALPFFMAISGIAFVVLVYFVHVAPKEARLGPAILGLLLAGVFGNFWDRTAHVNTLGVAPEGSTVVRDFLSVHTPDSGIAHDLLLRIFKSTHWPVFNAADVFICIGAFAIVIGLWREDRKKAKATPPPAPAGPAPAPAPAT